MKRMAAIVLLLSTGCGSVFHGSTQEIPVNSIPSGATARATCSDGSSVEAKTPGTLLLRRNAEGCVIAVSKTGYEPQSIPLTRGKSASMITNVPTSILSALGGILTGAIVCSGNSNITGTCAGIGGILGLILPGYVDARTGAMYTQQPHRLDVTLKPSTP